MATAQASPPPPVSDTVASYYSNQPTAVAATAPVFAPVPAGSSVLIMGDSYVQGYGADDMKTQGYAYMLGQSYGWNVTVDAVGRTGFWSGGGVDRTDKNTYKERVDRLGAAGTVTPSLVVFQGSQNDYPATSIELGTKIRETVASVKQYWPDAQIVIIGPAAPMPNGASLKNVNQVAYLAAADVGAFFINPLGDGWMTTENSPGYAFTDGWHVNTAGHAYLASKIKETLDAFAAAS
ncbi:SGNH/GDSL hydrolase family protein [Arthrobacter sp. Rue61a]|uniref:SGNH/GDSL hydrolase family protein n=1 Tax=Arthrobacter sp. Rue61a TaxID=1118963 RepID=UPI00027DF444|nr:SGNH/GDSL hydrolase family protein [Arthrobacter sp. Rue61a]AFR30204.1 lipolytic protein G-D-S-L family [Arthrobacter sp. Rue61a]